MYFDYQLNIKKKQKIDNKDLNRYIVNRILNNCFGSINDGKIGQIF